jgi:hypothetical protein
LPDRGAPENAIPLPNAPGQERGFPSGVYRIDAVQRQRIEAGEAVPPGTRMIALNGDSADTREAFFTEIAQALYFPDHFGRNWDAVYDCLTDPSVIPAEGVAIVCDGCGRFAVAMPDQWPIALKVFQDACDFWQSLDRRMYVFLPGLPAGSDALIGLPLACFGDAGPRPVDSSHQR